MAEIAKQIEGFGRQIPRLSLMVVVVAVLMPAVNYSLRLSDPTPSQLLVAICIGVFSSVICLWLLDAVSILRFRSEWVSRSVWGAAIVPILGTGVGVFQGAFAERKYPYEGQWLVRVYSPSENAFVAERQAVLIYSQSTESYWGDRTPHSRHPLIRIGQSLRRSLSLLLRFRASRCGCFSRTESRPCLNTH